MQAGYTVKHCFFPGKNRSVMWCKGPVWYGSAGRDQIKRRKWDKKHLKLAWKGAWKLSVERFRF